MPLTLWIACLLAVRNLRILGAWHNRQADNASRTTRDRPNRNPTHARRQHAPGEQKTQAAPALADTAGEMSLPNVKMHRGEV